MPLAKVSADVLPAAIKKGAKFESTGDLRKVSKNVLLALMHGEMKREDALVAAKLIDSMSVSLYSEIKYSALLVQLGREVPDLGELPLFGREAA